MANVTRACALCEGVKALTEFDLTDDRKGRRRTCSACTTSLGKVPRIIQGGHQLCLTCGYYQALADFEFGDASRTCLRCMRGPAHAPLGIPSPLVAFYFPRGKVQAPAPGFAVVSKAVSATSDVITDPFTRDGVLAVLAQLGAARAALLDTEVKLRDGQVHVGVLEARVTLLADEADRLALEHSDLTTKLQDAYARNEELKKKLDRLPAAPPQELVKAVPAVAPADPDFVAILEFLDTLPPLVCDETLGALGSGAAVLGRSYSEILDWLRSGWDKVLEGCIKDPVNQARALKGILRVHLDPFTYGEPVRRDRFALGPKTWKARAGRKIRIFYTVTDDRKVTITEVSGRADAYTPGTVAARRQSNSRSLGGQRTC